MRCTHCGHSWHQLPPLDAPHPVFFDEQGEDRGFGPTDEFGMDAGFDRDTGDDDAFVPMEPIRSVAASRAHGPSALARWAVLLVILGALGAGGYFGRAQITALWPPAALAYATAGLPVEPPGIGLQLQNVRSEQRIEDGATVLVIEGQVHNATEAGLDVPALRVVSLGPDRSRVKSWVVPVNPGHLGAGESANFQYTQRDPGPVAEVSITFDGV